MNHQANAVLGGDFDDGPALLFRRRDGFLADDINSFRSDQLDQIEMRFWRGDDIDKVRFLYLEHLLQFRPSVDLGHAMAFGRSGRAFRISVGQGDDIHIRDTVPRFVLEAGEVSGAQTDSFETFTHFGRYYLGGCSDRVLRLDEEPDGYRDGIEPSGHEEERRG